MSNDPWLRELAQVKRDEEAEERSRLDERWDRLSAGDLSPEEEAELRALAGTSEEAREAFEAFRPLGPEFHARVVGALTSELKDSAAAAPVEPRSRSILPFRPFRPSPARVGGWLTAAAAVAAVLIVFLRPPAPLPDYASPEVLGGTRASRGEEIRPGEAPAFEPGDRIQVILRPETAASKAGMLSARCVLTRDGDARIVDTRTQIDPGGSVKMEGTLGPDLQPGAWTLWAVVGRRGKLPDPADLRALSARAGVRHDDWTALPKEIRIQPRASSP
jgi:hypothetical protein